MHGISAKVAAVLAGCAALSACSSSGGDAAGSTTAEDYNIRFDAVSALGATQNMPTSLQADYRGELMADLSDGSGVLGTVLADLDIAVDWTEGQTANPFSGTADNFREVGGAARLEGTLTVDDGFGGSIIRSSVPVPGTTVEVDTGAGQFVMTGDLTQDGTSYETELTLGGTFFGDAGEAMVGAVSGGLRTPGSGAAFDYAAGGTFYLQQQ